MLEVFSSIHTKHSLDGSYENDDQISNLGPYFFSQIQVAVGHFQLHPFIQFIHSDIYLSTYCAPDPYMAMNRKKKICGLMELTFSWVDTSRAEVNTQNFDTWDGGKYGEQ